MKIMHEILKLLFLGAWIFIAFGGGVMTYWAFGEYSLLSHVLFHPLFYAILVSNIIIIYGFVMYFNLDNNNGDNA